MPVYEEKDKVNGQKRYFVRAYVETNKGNKIQITRRNKNWIGRQGKFEAERINRQLIENVYNENQDTTLDQLIKCFLDYKKPMIKFTTYHKYCQDIDSYIKPYFNTSKKIVRITTRDVLEWQQEINKLNISFNTKKRTHTTFSSIIKHGCIFFDLEKNVVNLAGTFKISKSNTKKEMNFLTISEFEKFISYEKNILYKNFFTILFNTGIRRGELLALTKEDVNLVENTISINKTYSPKYDKFGIGSTPPKTECSNRTIKMLDVVRDIFIELNKHTKENDRYFSEITLTTLKRKCDTNCKMANIKKQIRIHDFRHSFASMCIDKNVPIEVISNYLGHENISITLDVYSHLYPDSQNKLLNALQKNQSSKIEDIKFESQINDTIIKMMNTGKTKEQIMELFNQISSNLATTI